MAHKEYIRKIPGSNTAILCIHGILSTPDYFNKLIERVPEEWSIYNILLDGHGKKVSDFSRASMKKWEVQVDELLKELSRGYENIMIVGHSMGTLFAIDAALHYPKVKMLFLLAVPLKIAPKISVFTNALRIAFERVPENNPIVVASRNAYSIAPDKRLWRYIAWIPRYLELFHKVSVVKKEYMQLEVPCYIIHSQKDEFISRKALTLIRENKKVKAIILKESTHNYYQQEDQRIVVSKFEEACNRIIDL